jgi:hypothetical protein
MAGDDRLYLDTLKPLLSDTLGLNCLQTVFKHRLDYLNKLSSEAAITACFDDTLRARAVEFIGRRNEVAYLNNLITKLREAN